jgi:hypothetical protein
MHETQQHEDGNRDSLEEGANEREENRAQKENAWEPSWRTDSGRQICLRPERPKQWLSICLSEEIGSNPTTSRASQEKKHLRSSFSTVEGITIAFS